LVADHRAVVSVIVIVRYDASAQQWRGVSQFITVIGIWYDIWSGEPVDMSLSLNLFEGFFWEARASSLPPHVLRCVAGVAFELLA
jgi:hypothetical protein